MSYSTDVRLFDQPVNLINKEFFVCSVCFFTVLHSVFPFTPCRVPDVKTGLRTSRIKEPTPWGPAGSAQGLMSKVLPQDACLYAAFLSVYAPSLLLYPSHVSD